MKHNQMTTAALLLLASASTGNAESTINCADVFDRPALLEEHVYCTSSSDADGLSAYFRRNVFPNTYDAKVAHLPTQYLKQLAASYGHKPNDHVPVVAKPRPDWLSATRWTFQHSATGGGTPVRLPLQCLTGPGQGHAELSRDAAIARQWKPAAADLLAASSRDADDFEWENLPAHALSGDSSPSASTTAIAGFEAWLKLNQERLFSECAQARPDAAIYVMAYMLHAVQDLALHAGMTRAEQAGKTLAGASAESDPKRVSRAKDWTGRTLKKIEERLPADCIKAIKASSSVDRPAGVAGQYFGNRDRTATAAAAFTQLGNDYLTANPPSSAWYSTTNANAANRFWEQHVRDVVDSVNP